MRFHDRYSCPRKGLIDASIDCDVIFNGTAVFELVNHRATDTEDAACATGPDRRYWEARYNADRRWGGDSSLPIPPYPAFEDNVVDEGKAAEQSRVEAPQEEEEKDHQQQQDRPRRAGHMSCFFP